MSIILKAGMARMEYESKNYETRISALEAENARLRNRLELIKNRDCECEYDEEGERDILCPSCLAAGALSDGKLQEVLAEALSAVKEE